MSVLAFSKFNNVTSYKVALENLKVFAEANGWTIQEYKQNDSWVGPHHITGLDQAAMTFWTSHPQAMARRRSDSEYRLMIRQGTAQIKSGGSGPSSRLILGMIRHHLLILGNIMF